MGVRMRTATTTAIALAAFLSVSLGAAAPTLASAATCTPATNIEAIVDDSARWKSPTPTVSASRGWTC